MTMTREELQFDAMRTELAKNWNNENYDTKNQIREMIIHTYKHYHTLAQSDDL